MPEKANLRVGLPGHFAVDYTGLLLIDSPSNEHGAV